MRVQLALLTDLERFPDPVPVLGRLCALAAAGTVAVVLRDRDAGYQERLAVGRQLRQITRDSGQALLVADRVDLALELGADGVHLPADGLLPSEVQELASGLSISRSHHRIDALPEAELRRLGLVLVSPAFEARKGRPALGSSGLRERLALLRRLCPAARLLALGGVDDANAREALAGGADGIAAIGAVHRSDTHAGLLGALGNVRG